MSNNNGMTEAQMDQALDIIVNAKTSQGGGDNYFRHGEYKLQTVELKLFQGNDGLCFKGEFYILGSRPKSDDVRPNPPGSLAVTVMKLAVHKSAPGNTKALLSALLAGLGHDVGALSDQEYRALLRSATSPNQPLRGSLSTNATYLQKIKNGPNAGKIITLNHFRAVEGQTKESLAQSRRELEAALLKMSDSNESQVESKPVSTVSAASMLDGLGL